MKRDALRLLAPHYMARGHANWTVCPVRSAAMKQAGYSCVRTGVMIPLTTDVHLYRGSPKLLERSAFQVHVALIGGAEVRQDSTPVCWLNSGVTVLHSIIGKKNVSIFKYAAHPGRHIVQVDHEIRAASEARAPHAPRSEKCARPWRRAGPGPSLPWR